MYILDILYIQRHPSAGPADSDLPPKQAEDNLRFYVNTSNVK